MLHDIPDSPELLAIRLDLYNLREYFLRPLSEENFRKADAALKEVWRRFDAYNAKMEKERHASDREAIA